MTEMLEAPFGDCEERTRNTLKRLQTSEKRPTPSWNDGLTSFFVGFPLQHDSASFISKHQIDRFKIAVSFTTINVHPPLILSSLLILILWKGYGGFYTSRPSHAKPQGCNAQCSIIGTFCKSLPERKLGATKLDCHGSNNLPQQTH